MSDSTRRLALLFPYWAFWERSARIDLRFDRTLLAAQVAQVLEGFAVVASEAFESAEGAEQAASRIRAAGAEALVVIQSMAVPPGYTLAALDALPALPLVVWAVHRRERLLDSFDHSDITTEGATVGTSQLGNVLARKGRPWALVVGRLDDEDAQRRLGRALGAAATASRLQGARIGLVGSAPDGYDSVACDPGELARATGMTIVAISPKAVRDAYLGAARDRVAAIERETRDAFEIAADAEDNEALARSLRFAAAMEELDRIYGLDAGAMNCHVPELRFSAEPGITPCFALGRETTRGIPWTCAGDVVTAVAMLTAKRLGAATLYHELESLDYVTGEALIANTGEHDLAWARKDRPLLRRNSWFDSDERCGVCACFGLSSGPATLVAFTPHSREPSGFRYVVAEGEFTNRTFPSSGTPNGAFRFAGLPAHEGFGRWVLAGAGHHSSASPGLLGAQVAQVAEYLGIGCIQTS